MSYVSTVTPLGGLTLYQGSDVVPIESIRKMLGTTTDNIEAFTSEDEVWIIYVKADLFHAGIPCFWCLGFNRERKTLKNYTLQRIMIEGKSKFRLA